MQTRTFISKDGKRTIKVIPRESRTIIEEFNFETSVTQNLDVEKVAVPMFIQSIQDNGWKEFMTEQK